MPHHAARLRTPLGLPLSSILQAAAAQAWSRRAHLNSTRSIATKVSAENTPTSSFSRPPPPHLRLSPANSRNDGSSSRPTTKRPSFAASETPTLKPVNNTSVHPQRPNCHGPLVDGRKTVPHPRQISLEPAPEMSRPFKLIRARRINPESLSTRDFDWRDPGRVGDEDGYVDWADLEDIEPQICNQTEMLPYVAEKPTTSPESLYWNLLRLISNWPFSLQEVIKYHSDCPKSMHSTASFNLLIHLALRCASFGVVGLLLKAMETEGVPRDMETIKLHVRWLVRTDRWNEAWKFVLRVKEHKNASTRRPNDPIPLVLWLELLGTQKRGALRHWIVTKAVPGMEHNAEPGVQTGPTTPWAYDMYHAEASWADSAGGDFDAGWEAERAGRFGGREETVWSEGLDWDTGVEDAEPPPTQVPHGYEKRLVPRPWRKPLTVEQAQYRALMQVSPLHMASNNLKLPPRTIIVLTGAMLHVGERNLALSTALSYLASLPRRLSLRDRRAVVDLVNVHLAMVTRRGKPGLKQHFAQRRLLRKFLDAHPDLTPSPMTLYLLLGPLHGCRRGGTLAMQCLRLFEKRWGSRIQSKMVRRRIANLALKEGRLDIVRTVIKLQQKADRGVIRDDDLPPIPTKRPVWGEKFSRGVENRRWAAIEAKYLWRVRLLP